MGDLDSVAAGEARPEATFVDTVSRNLRLGRFLLLVVGAMTTTTNLTTLRAEVEGLRGRLEAEERQRLTLAGRVRELLATVEAMASRLGDVAATVGSMSDEVPTRRLEEAP